MQPSQHQTLWVCWMCHRQWFTNQFARSYFMRCHYVNVVVKACHNCQHKANNEMKISRCFNRQSS